MPLTVQLPMDSCFPERAFIAEVLLRDRLGLEIRILPAPTGEVAIVGEDGARLTMPDRFFPRAIRHWLKPGSLPELPLRTRSIGARVLPGQPGGCQLPVIFGLEPEVGPLVRRGFHETRLALDVFGSAFFMLTRYEELATPQRDGTERFPGRACLAGKSGFLHRPVIDEYLTLLWYQMRALWPGLRRTRPGYALRLSHDLDWSYAAFGGSVGTCLQRLAGDVLVRRSVSLGRRRVRSLLATGREAYDLDPDNTFEFIMDTDERAGHPSVFFLSAGRTGPEGTPGASLLDQPRIRLVMRRCRERGHELGLSPSEGTFRDATALGVELGNLLRATEAEGIRQPAWGGRQHGLRWDAGTTWRSYEQAGLAYDSSLGYPDRAGFRCGTCHPFQSYDLLERHPLRLVERPLIAADTSLLVGMNLPLAAAPEALRPLVDQCRAYAGEFALLWHNRGLITSRERSCYREIVAMAS